MRLKWGLETSFDSYHKYSAIFKFIITLLSYISQKKKKKSEQHLPCEAD